MREEIYRMKGHARNDGKCTHIAFREPISYLDFFVSCTLQS